MGIIDPEFRKKLERWLPLAYGLGFLAVVSSGGSMIFAKPTETFGNFDPVVDLAIKYGAPIWGPLLFITLYAFLGFFIHRPMKISDQKFADSLYYLGFLFTLIALLSAFTTVKPDAVGSFAESVEDLAQIQDGKNKAMAELVKQAGVAMLTTIWGLLLKLIYTYWRLNGANGAGVPGGGGGGGSAGPSPADAAKLTTIIAELSVQLGNATDGIKCFSAEFALSQQAVRESAAASSESLSRATQEIAESLKAIRAEVETSVKAVAEEPTKRFVASIDLLRTELTTLNAKHFTHVAEAMSTYSDTLRKANAAMAHHVKKSQAVADAWPEMGLFRTALETLNSACTKLVRLEEALSLTNKRFDDNLARIAAQLDCLRRCSLPEDEA